MICHFKENLMCINSNTITNQLFDVKGMYSENNSLPNYVIFIVFTQTKIPISTSFHEH